MTSSEFETIKNICTLIGSFRRLISIRATSRFKFERDWRYLFIQIKMTKEGRYSLHLLRGCSTHMYRSFPKNNSKKIRYLTLDLNTNSESTSWYTQPPTTSALLAWILAPDMFGYKNIKHFRFLLSNVNKTTFLCFLTKTTLLMIISEFRSRKSL